MEVEPGGNGVGQKLIGRGRPGLKIIKPEADWMRPIHIEAKAAEAEVEVVEAATPDLQAVEAGEHEEGSSCQHSDEVL